ncbi:DUF732 domain-containing protein [Mycobacterium avium]|uniref:DUF732 domain-containing protein n=1 Tax=Mycobacterium avium TaxID=1764 RepID=UPI000A04EAC5|nr:DUF732 domain-containing protein [Mycobacterium avium]MBZ4612457.1 DUF732 domain-containing protein [Mycobacterium avium subsp. hominissuis]
MFHFVTTIKGAAIALAVAGIAATALGNAASAQADESTYLSLVHSRDIAAPDPTLISLGYQVCADARAHTPKDNTVGTIDQQAQISDRIEAMFVYNAALINLCPGVQPGP